MIAAASVAALLGAGSALAAQGPVPTGVPALDHVFVIMMENHAYGQIAGNPQAPFINAEMGSAATAAKYYALAHPSSTNYLEVVGGSNFNKLSDQYPDWHNTKCTPNLTPGQSTNTDVPDSGLFCPIAGTGTEAAIPAVDMTQNETSAPPLTNIDGVASIPARTDISGISIADQLVAAGKTWKSYQEGLPDIGADGVNVSDGIYSIGGPNAAGVNVTSDFASLSTSTNPVSASDVVYLYAVKHNPFAYFASVQQPTNQALSLGRVTGFDGEQGLFADLRQGTVPSFAFIAPNQCNDQHGRGNGTAFCNFDADDNGTQTGLNPSLILQGDLSLQKIVTAIKTVYDPEIPADVYELGLIYKIDIADDRAVHVEMTLTTPNCPSAQELPTMVENAVASVPGVGPVDVKVVWEPPWEPSRMSDEARVVLNMW